MSFVIKYDTEDKTPMTIALAVVATVVFFAYKRYAPIFGIKAIKSIPNKFEDTILLDLRDYQTTAKDPISESLNIPFAYMQRYYKEIPNKKLIILATDTVEKNLAIRFLTKKGLEVTGFLINDQRGEEKWNMISKQKIV